MTLHEIALVILVSLAILAAVAIIVDKPRR